MSYSLQSSPFDDYLLVRIEGAWPRGEPKKFISDIVDLSDKHPDLALLIDVRAMKATASMADDYFDAKRMADAGFGRLGRIAVLDILARKEANDFFETTAFNRGLTARFFYSDEQEAIDWLLSEGNIRHD